MSDHLEPWKRSGLGTGKVSSSTVRYSKETYPSSKAQPGCSMQPFFSIKLHRKRHAGENNCGDATVYIAGVCRYPPLWVAAVPEGLRGKLGSCLKASTHTILTVCLAVWHWTPYLFPLLALPEVLLK